ncbi:Transmembrane protein 87B [Triticum urartu]|uniref:Transmembrane protein 87B n=1 Tax=Triticum urartu TaxID=4572 RepID=M8A9H2_TRIUA|nr:Transmembrane protein 87B [Triticum urartu]
MPMPGSSSVRLAHLLVSALCCAILLCADASVHDYTAERFAGLGNAFVLNGGSEGVYASPAADSFIRFEKVAFKRTPESAAAAGKDGNLTATITAVIFEAADRGAVGGSDVVAAGARALCCTPDMAKRGACTEGSLVYRAPNSTAAAGWPRVLAASFLPGALEAIFPDETVAVARTGMYSLRFVHCDASLDNFVTVVIALGMVEVTTWYLDLAEFSESGVRPAGTTFWAATSGAVRRTVSRVLVLLVAKGYGVVRPTLGGGASAGARVAGLGAVFLAASEALEVSEHVGAVSDHDHSPTRRLFLVLTVAALDAVFICWIFSALSRTISKLKARRMTAKVETYRRLATSLTIAVAVSLGWIAFEVHFKSTDGYQSERWRVAWVIPAVWQLISFALLCAVCLVWAPSHDSARLACSDEAGDDDDGDDVEDGARPLMLRTGPLSYVENWACYVTQDAKIILRTDSGVYAKAGEEDKRV